MKKALLAIASVAVLASCAKSEVQYEPTCEIALAPVTENRTKAMVSTNEFPATEQFAVWAFYKQVAVGTTIADWQTETGVEQTTYIDEKPFKATSTVGLWGGAEASYFWPKAGSLMFVGYYPTSMSDKVSYDFTSAVNKMTVAGYSPTTDGYGNTGFVATDAATCTEDFMYFNMTAASCDATTTGPDNSVTTGNHVDVVFRHALSWLTVVLKKDTSTPAGATITVKDVYFTDINTTGTGVVNNSPASNENKTIAWTTTEATTDVYVLGGADTEDKVTDNTTPLTSDYTCKQPVLIPQDMSDNLVITYEIKSSDGSAFTETTVIDLSDINDGTVDTWDPSKHYTYNVTIGTSEILIDPVVEAWTDVTTAVSTN